MSLRLATWLVAVLAAAPLCASAQTGPAADSHALVLSGGGARGLSHAGALVALKQLGYDPSLIVGTSMGAIVGAMYAAGYSPDEVWTFVAEENWLERFSAEPVPVGATRAPLRPVLGFGTNPGRFYEGLLPTTNVNLRLVELLFDAGARARNDFDRLPRRYRAVAADLGTGEEVVLGRGDLPRAVRASMAVPGAFAPVLWDGRILADGGLANNLPVSVAAALTDAPIIAVDVLQPTDTLDERGSIDLGVRALRLLIANARPDSVQPDILVLPRIGTGFSETRFPADATRLLEKGRAAVLEQVPPVPTAPPAPSAGRREAGAPPREIAAVRVDADDPAIARLVRRIMRPTVGAYDAAAIIERTAALYGTGLFQGVWPRLEFPDGDEGAATLVVDITPVASSTITGAVRWDDDTGGAAWGSLRQRLSFITPIEVRGVVRLTELGHAGSMDATAFSTLLPGVNWTAGVHAVERQIRTFEDGAVIAHDRHRRTGGWAGAELHGPVHDWFVSVTARAEQIERDSGKDGWGYGAYIMMAPPPRMDRVTGVEPLLEWEARVGATDYTRAHIRLGLDGEFGRVRAAAFVDAHGATAGTPLDAQPAAARELVPWLPAHRLRSRATGTVGLDIAHALVLDAYARVRLRAFGSGGESGLSGSPGTEALRHADAWYPGGELGVVWPAFIGPISAGIAAGRGDWRLNLSAGTVF